MDGRSAGLLGHLICHCFLIETSADLVLVDTGYGLNDVQAPLPRLSGLMLSLLNIRLREQETAIRQIQALGFHPTDVRHIVLTHLDFDHAGGLEDFPEATVHVMETEFEAFSQRSGFVSRRRYRPMQLENVKHWQLYRAGGSWFGFDAVTQLNGLPPEILMVPLTGHTWGHAGIAVHTGSKWLLHAGDAYFHQDEMRASGHSCPIGLKLYQRLMEVDRSARLNNQQRLRLLERERGQPVQIVCAHDRAELEFARTGIAGLAAGTA